MQSPDHLECKWPFAIEHFVHAISAADEGNEIPRLKSILAHMILDRLYGVGQIKRIMLTLPRLHQRNKYIKTITLAGVALGGPSISLSVRRQSRWDLIGTIFITALIQSLHQLHHIDGAYQ